MKQIKVGDRLRFKKFDWVIVAKQKSRAGVTYYRYQVLRKYFFNHRIPLKYTDQSYVVFPERWLFLRSKLRENPDYHYTMSLWSNRDR